MGTTESRSILSIFLKNTLTNQVNKVQNEPHFTVSCLKYCCRTQFLYFTALAKGGETERTKRYNAYMFLHFRAPLIFKDKYGRTAMKSTKIMT